MSNSGRHEQTNEFNKRKKRGRLTLALIAMAFIVPLLAAAWMQRIAFQDGIWGSTNHGELIQPPLALVDFLLPGYEGSVFMLANLKEQWTLLYVAPSVTECAEACRKAVYHMRQIRLALGRDMSRVQRVLLAAPESPWLEELAAEYEGMHIVLDIGLPNSLLQQLAQRSDPLHGGIYLIDPLGNAMMIFASATDPRDILKDLKKLLRNSKIG
jgi:cytochrome oxidase Cu insertion factor (SCO1/SenC/PrrC family)